MSALLPYIIIGPEGVLATGQCDFILIPTARGGVGIMAGHEPMVAGLAAGEVRLRTGDNVQRLFVEGGVCRVQDGQARLVVGRLLEESELDPQELAGREAALTEVAGRVTAPGLQAELRRRAHVAHALLAALQSAKQTAVAGITGREEQP